MSQTKNVSLEQKASLSPKAKATDENLCRINRYENMNGIAFNGKPQATANATNRRLRLTVKRGSYFSRDPRLLGSK